MALAIAATYLGTLVWAHAAPLHDYPMQSEDPAIVKLCTDNGGRVAHDGKGKPVCWAPEMNKHIAAHLKLYFRHPPK